MSFLASWHLTTAADKTVGHTNLHADAIAGTGAVYIKVLNINIKGTIDISLDTIFPIMIKLYICNKLQKR